MNQPQNQVAQKPTNQWHQAIESAKDKFSGSGLDFFQEQIFATQLLMNNSYLLDVAKKNPLCRRCRFRRLLRTAIEPSSNGQVDF